MMTRESSQVEPTMQQIALPSLYDPRRRRRAQIPTTPFPLVRRREGAVHRRTRKFVAGLLFGVLMSLTLLLLGYEARLYANQHPNLWQNALESAKALAR
jgi:hypothetical protein